MRISWAEWRGPVQHRTAGGLTHPTLGVVMHIMGASMSAADGWFHNPQSKVSAHFGIANNGHLVQWVDTDDRSWAQGAGNSMYYSVETEGSSGPLTAPQVDTFARLYAELQHLDGFPFALADKPGEHGLGWHGMGGQAWGGHPYCPGEDRKKQRLAILTRAQGGQPPTTGGFPMALTDDEQKRLFDAVARIDKDTDVLQSIGDRLTAIEKKIGTGAGGATAEQIADLIAERLKA
jgi:hypothetical protein